MAHIFFIDPLEKLVPKKDSTLLLALTMQEMGQEVRVLFEKDLFYLNKQSEKLKLYQVSGGIAENFYLQDFKLNGHEERVLSQSDTVHMRIDPPFDGRYLRYLWILNEWEERGIKILNSAKGILLNNEKMKALCNYSSLESYVGSDVDSFGDFLETMISKNIDSLIIKPLDLYQGIGVEKLELKKEGSEKVKKAFLESSNKFGALVAQPYAKSVETGELRSVYFDGKLIGAITKIPPEGNFLANIAQGAEYFKCEVPEDVDKNCREICASLKKDGVRWTAFDILGDAVSEVNVTCPGLVVELSSAYKINLARTMAEMILS